MSATIQSPQATQPRFDNAQEWLDSLGDVPLRRIIFVPPFGTATEEDLLALVDGDNKRLCELVDGTLVEKTMGTYESFLAGWLITYLNNFLELNPVGVVTGEAGLMRLSSGRIRVPDVAYISFERLNGRDFAAERVSPISPDLAVEVFSDGNTKSEMQQKTREYFQSGARLVWIVYPRQKIVEIFEQATEYPTCVLTETDTLDGGPVLPGFTLQLAKLFSKRAK